MVKVAIFYTLAGGGHISLACSAKDALTKYAGSDYQIELFDPFPESFAITHKALINHFLEVYRLGYKMTENPQIESTIRRLTDIVIKTTLLKFCKRFQPDIVIANHPLIAAVLPALRKKVPRPFKSVVHFADPFTTHQSWFFNKTADLYLSPTDEITQQSLSSGIPAARIKTVGWILRDQFYNPSTDPKLTKKILGLDPQKFTVFLGGTGQGAADILSICSHLAASPDSRKLQVIVNTGLNAELVEKLLDLVRENPDLFYLIPYVKNMPDLLSCSNIVVGKAGPNFMFETLAVGKPLLVTSYLPGQESGNITYLKNNSLGWVILDPILAAKKILSLALKPKAYTPKIPTIHKQAPQKFVRQIQLLTSTSRNSKPSARV